MSLLHFQNDTAWPRGVVREPKRFVVFDLLALCPEWGFSSVEKATCLLSPCCLLNAPLVFYTRLCSVPLRRALRRHLYLGELALHLCPLDLPGSFVIGVGLLQLASPRLLLPQLLSKLLQQRPQGLQHMPVLPELHREDSHKTII